MQRLALMITVVMLFLVGCSPLEYDNSRMPTGMDSNCNKTGDELSPNRSWGNSDQEEGGDWWRVESRLHDTLIACVRVGNRVVGYTIYFPDIFQAQDIKVTDNFAITDARSTESEVVLEVTMSNSDDVYEVRLYNITQDGYDAEVTLR